jgi:uncharacterized membrane protein
MTAPQIPPPARAGAPDQRGPGLAVDPGAVHHEQGRTTPPHLHPANRHRHDDRTPGQRLADSVTAVFGSWRFIIIQTCIVAVWIAVNLIAVI